MLNIRSLRSLHKYCSVLTQELEQHKNELCGMVLVDCNQRTATWALVRNQPGSLDIPVARNIIQDATGLTGN